MFDFLAKYWTEILSIVGAAAWLPIVLRPILNYFRKVQATLLDSRILTNGKGISVGQKCEKHGTILMLAINFYINGTNIFARKMNYQIKLKSGAQLTSELLDFSTLTSNNDDNTISAFKVPLEYEFNVSRTIHKDVDNLKFISLLVENADFKTIDDIECINITLYYGSKNNKLFSKSITISSADFPVFNSSKLIEKVEVITKTNC